jgi:hypothetical protein
MKLVIFFAIFWCTISVMRKKRKGSKMHGDLCDTFQTTESGDYKGSSLTPGGDCQQHLYCRTSSEFYRSTCLYEKGSRPSGTCRDNDECKSGDCFSHPVTFDKTCVEQKDGGEECLTEKECSTGQCVPNGTNSPKICCYNKGETKFNKLCCKAGTIKMSQTAKCGPA